MDTTNQPVNNSQFTIEDAPQTTGGAPHSGFTIEDPQGGSSAPPAAPSTMGGVQNENFSEHPVMSSLEHLSNMGTNFLRGAETTAQGASDLIHRIPGIGEALVPSEGLKAWNNTSEGRQAAGSTVDRVVGYGGENFLEFLMGDEALKGVTYAEKLLQAGKVAKMLEGSPKLMAALKSGAALMKGGDEYLKLLDPATQAMLQNSPILRRLVGAGVEAMRAGTIQGAQTAVRTQGSLAERAGEGAKDAAIMGGTSAVLSAPLSVAGGMMERAGKAGQTVQHLSDTASTVDKTRESAGNAVDQATNAAHAVSSAIDVPGNVSGEVLGAHGEMGSRYAQGLEEKVKEPLQDVTHEFEGSPVQVAAQKVEGLAENSDKWMKAAGETTPISNSAKSYIKQVANAFEDDAEEVAKPDKWVDANGVEHVEPAAPAEAKEPYKIGIQDLTKQRQILMERTREARASGNWSDAKAYSMVIDGIDETIDKMAQQSGNPQVMADYAAIRNDYRQTKQLFEDKDTRGVVQDLMRGGLDPEAVRSKILNNAHADKIIDNLKQIVDRQTSVNGAQTGRFQALGNSLAHGFIEEGPEKLLGYSPDKLRSIERLVGGVNFGKLGDVATNHLIAQGSDKLLSMTPTKLDNLQRFVGDGNFIRLRDNAIGKLIQDAAPKVAGERAFNPDAYLKTWNALKEKYPVAMQRMFSRNTVTKDAVDAMNNAIKESAGVKQMVKVTYGVGTVGAMGALELGGWLAGPMGSAATTVLDVFGLTKMRQFVEWMANHPYTWKAMRGAGAVAPLADKTAAAVPKAVKATSAAVLAVPSRLSRPQ